MKKCKHKECSNPAAFQRNICLEHWKKGKEAFKKMREIKYKRLESGGGWLIPNLTYGRFRT